MGMFKFVVKVVDTFLKCKTHISVKFFRVQNFIDFQLIINNLKLIFY